MASPGFWQPSVMGSAPVQYPSLPFPMGQQNNHTTPASALAMYSHRPVPTAGSGPAYGGVGSSAFGVKSGDFGGGSVFGVKTGDFGNPSPNTNDIQWNTHTVGGGGLRVGGGAGGGMNAGGLASWYQDAMNRANQANEARYRDALGGYQSRYQRGMNMLAGLGQQEGRDINESYDAQQAKINQDLIGRGLGNSTVMTTMAMGNNRERNADLGRLNDRVRNQALSQDSNLSGDVLQFMERKTDKPPDVGLLAQLYQGMGQAGYGMGGYGGGGYGPDYSGGFNPYMFQPQMPYYYGGSSPQNQARLNTAADYYRARNAEKQNQQPYYYSPNPSTGSGPATSYTPTPDAGLYGDTGYGPGYDPWFAGG